MKVTEENHIESAGIPHNSAPKKLSKWETNLFFTVLLIKHNECTGFDSGARYKILIDYVPG